MQSTIYNFRLWNVILKLKLPITLPNRTNNSDIVFQRSYQAFHLVLSAIILFCFRDTSLLIIENGMLFFGFSIWSKTTCSLFFFPIWNLHDNSLVFRFHPYFHHLCLPHKIFSTAVENDLHFTIALHGYRLRRLATLQIQVRAQTARKLFTLNYTKYFYN